MLYPGNLTEGELRQWLNIVEEVYDMEGRARTPRIQQSVFNEKKKGKSGLFIKPIKRTLARPLYRE